MRRFDEVARFWNDTRSRLPQSAVVVAAGRRHRGALFTADREFVRRSGRAASNAAVTPVAAHDACQDQTWPYLSDACLQQRNRPGRRPQTAREAAGPGPQYEPEMAAAAVGATPWAPKDARHSARQRPRNERQTAGIPDLDAPAP